jgi:glycosyltransferase involved in cell wall biosynthesis
VRILQVIHQFPPFSSQGSEVYCYNLARQLNTSDDVSVFHVSNVTPRHPRRLIRTTHDGLRIYHCVDGAEYARLADWPNEFLRTAFQEVLAEFAPDVVHFHNYLSLGDDLVTLARASGPPVVYTLHDFGLICPNALLLTTDGALCGKQDPDFFQDCCPVLVRTAGGRRPLVAARLPSLARWRLYAGHHPRPVVRAALLGGVRAAEQFWGEPRHTDIAEKRNFFLTHTRQIFRDVDLFLAPSRFLMQRYVSCGLAPARIAYVRNGMRLFPRRARQRSGQGVRFGYIGAFHAQKGVDILLEAFRDLGNRASLHLYGSTFGSPISESYWRRVREGQGGNVVFHGAYDNERVDEILASLDVVVVPSRWYENAPLTIQEAFIGGVPVITADRGGMAEQVRDGIDGLHFRLGDAADLREKLLRVANDPELLDRFRRNIPAVTSIEEHAGDVRSRYLALSASRGE